MTNLDSKLESKGITLLTKVYIVKAMVFPVVMYVGRCAITGSSYKSICSYGFHRVVPTDGFSPK